MIMKVREEKSLLNIIEKYENYSFVMMFNIFINFASIFIYIVAKIQSRVLVYVAVKNRR